MKNRTCLCEEKGWIFRTESGSIKYRVDGEYGLLLLDWKKDENDCGAVGLEIFYCPYCGKYLSHEKLDELPSIPSTDGETDDGLA